MKRIYWYMYMFKSPVTGPDPFSHIYVRKNSNTLPEPGSGTTVLHIKDSIGAYMKKMKKK
jgi:hypothetical protein